MNYKKIKLRVQGLTNIPLQNDTYALVLSEAGERRIPIMVGMFEAQSIAIALERINPPRPLTHDLFINYTKATDYQIQEILIFKFEDGVYFSHIVLKNGEKILKIDARTSDAVAIALRCNCPIYTTEPILKRCGIVPEKNSQINEDEVLPEELTSINLEDIASLKTKLQKLKKQELEKGITEAIAKEDYEFAQLYKDELLRRENKENNLR